MYIYKMIKKKVQRITVLRSFVVCFFFFYSNYGSSVTIFQGYIIPDFN